MTTKQDKAFAKLVSETQPADKPQKLTYGDRLYVLVSKAGSKTWYWNYRLDGKDLSYVIGKWPDISVDAARDARSKAEKLVEQGINPTTNKKQAVQQTKAEQATTFGGIAQEWIALNAADPANPADKQPGKWSKYYSQQVRNFMGRYVINAPVGQRPIKSITSPDIAALVQAVGIRDKATGDERKAKGAPSVAVLLKQWCGKVFSYAIATGRYENNNPANGFDLSDVVKKPKAKSNKALDEHELRAVLSALSQYTVKKDGRKYAGQRDTCIAIELLLLNAVRTVELRKARWSEFNFMTATWTIPGERMKMGLPHVVPLSVQSIALLQELRLINPPAKDGDGWLFPNRRRGSADCMSATTVNRALGNMGFNGDRLFRAHGARGTASTTLHGQDYDPLIVDSALAHKQKGVAGIYNQGKYLKQRRAMMQAYADHLDGLKTCSSDQVIGL